MLGLGTRWSPSKKSTSLLPLLHGINPVVPTPSPDGDVSLHASTAMPDSGATPCTPARVHRARRWIPNMHAHQEHDQEAWLCDSHVTMSALSPSLLLLLPSAGTSRSACTWGKSRTWNKNFAANLCALCHLCTFFFFSIPWTPIWSSSVRLNDYTFDSELPRIVCLTYCQIDCSLPWHGRPDLMQYSSLMQYLVFGFTKKSSASESILLVFGKIVWRFGIVGCKK